ncbi:MULTISPECIES: RNA polymerase sigma factor [Colwellia]|nr:MULTISPECIES: sigma-70 family RNA polymerase sigma factor [Colwellia]
MPYESMKYDQQHNQEISELIDLLCHCGKGDKVAFKRLYQQTAPRLNGIAYRITRNRDSANEVLQEAFIKIWENSSHYQVDKSEPFTWLAAIVRYRAYDRLRYDKRRHQADMIEFHEDDIQALNFNSQQLAFKEHAQGALNDCLAKLAQQQSQAILMAYLYGYSRADIAAYLKSPVNTIKSWIRRGLGKLQLCLKN